MSATAQSKLFTMQIDFVPEAKEREDFRALLQLEIEGALADLRREMENWADTEAQA